MIRKKSVISFHVVGYAAINKPLMVILKYWLFSLLTCLKVNWIWVNFRNR